MSQRAYLIVGASQESLPTEIPAWLMPIIDGLAVAREAHVCAEQAVSVVAWMPVDGATAERCSNVLGAFVQEHAPRVKELAKLFAARRGVLPPDIARSIGAELAGMLLICSNLAYRFEVLKVLAKSWEGNPGTALSLFGCVAEAAPGSSVTLDWIGTHLLGDAQPPTEHEA